jgi:hypothetical protein
VLEYGILVKQSGDLSMGKLKLNNPINLLKSLDEFGQGILFPQGNKAEWRNKR